MTMTNKGNGKGEISSSSREQANSVNEEFPPTLEDVSDDEIHEVPVEEEKKNAGAEVQPAAQSENEQLYEHPIDDNQRKRKYYYRHTKHQIKAMEGYYRLCPHPNDNQRRELSQELGLHPSQVKFWFQNKRTQMKTHRAHVENTKLRVENENLCCENIKLKENISACTCYRCGRHVMMPSDKHQLIRLENESLRRQIEHVTAMAENIAGNMGKAPGSSSTPLSSFNLSPPIFGVGAFGGQIDHIPFGDIPRRSHSSFRSFNSTSELRNAQLIELAILAMQEVDAMARIGEPLWIPDPDRNTVVLNPPEYFRIFQMSFPPKEEGFRSESSRASAVVIMSPLNIIEIFMEMSKWLAVFSGIVSEAILLDVISTGEAVGNYNGALQLMCAKLQALSPAIPPRECAFVRYCKQLTETTWAIVDVSIDALIPNGPIIRCKRKPSGCIIQAMPNDCSKITWVEHVEVQDFFAHSLSRSIISSGYAYGAKRWVSTLERQCDRLASASGIKDFPYFEDLNEIVLAHPEGRKCLLKLAERMVLSFYGGVIASPCTYRWTIVSGNGVDEVRIMTRDSKYDSVSPSGIVISASISFWIPVLPKTVFNYLRDERTRAEWDILSRKGGVQEMAYIGNGQEKSNCVSILRVNGSMVILQECSSEPTESMIVYAPVDVVSINKLLGGANPNIVQLLPSGFTILPSGPPGYGGGVDDDGITKGTLLSIAFQILGDPDSELELSADSIDTVKNLVKSTIRRIKIALDVKNYIVQKVA